MAGSSRVPASTDPGGHGAVALRLRAPAIVAGAGALAAAVLLLRDPHGSGSYGRCPILALTGQPCPACGGLRATNDLLHGQFAAAASSNVYAVVTVFLGIVAFVWWTAARVRGSRPGWADRSEWIGAVWLGGLVLFGALRLLPGLSSLQP